MSTFGLFTRTEAKLKDPKARRDLGGISVESLHKMGPKAIRLMNPEARSPEMPPQGVRHPRVYVLGEAPDEQDDEAGEYLTGSAGRLLTANVPERWQGKLRVGACVGTLPKLRGGSRRPSPVEVECFRGLVQADIEQSKPKAILLLGDVPLRWFLGNKIPGVKVCRGRWFAVKVGEHECWAYSVMHPAHLNRMGDKREDNIPGYEWKNQFRRDCKAFFKRLEDLPEPDIMSTEDKDLFAGVRTFDGSGGDRDLKQIAAFLERMKSEKAVATDLEANCLRPYRKGAKLLTISFGTAREVISVAYEHPQAKWTREQLKRLDVITKDFLLSPVPKIAHNAPVECEWFKHRYGEAVIRQSRWWCTMQQAYCLDERRGLGLGFLCTLHFGVDLKKLSKGKGATTSGLFSDETNIDRAKLERTDVQYVLRYNALDSKFTHKLFWTQRKLLKADGLWVFYRDWQNPRVLPIVMAQALGMPVDQVQVKAFATEYLDKEEQSLKAIAANEDVQAYEKKFRIKFDHSSNPHLLRMFRDFLGRKEGRRGKKYSTDEEAMEAMAKQGVPLATRIVEYRKAHKLLSTYIRPLDARKRDTCVYPDGRIHPQFNASWTATGRLSAEDPSVQNFPKRQNRQIRKMIAAPPGHTLVAVDYAQLEYRVIGMATKDAVILDSIAKGYDIHALWTQRIREADPKWFKTRFKAHKDEDKNFKDARGAVKNEWVFPAFYGAELGPIAGYLEIEERKLAPLFADFWQQFKGVKRWQNETLELYNQNGYVEGLSGRRRRGPLNDNMVYNSGIQGTASDLVIDAMTRLSAYAYEHEQPYLSPLINIHDDLTFLIPDEHLEDSLDVIVRQMLRTPYKWAQAVPLGVEVSAGKNWCDLATVGDFSAKDFN